MEFKGLSLLAVAAVALAATPASAQWSSASIGSKTDAILGGAPSSLAAITAAQNGAAPAPVALAAASSLPVASTYYRNAVAVRPTVAPLPVSADRPDVFGSVALRIGHSPLDARWARVASAGVTGSAAAFAEHLRGAGERERLEAVNAYVNSRVRFVDDQVQYHTADRWSAASETLARGRGDCEDYALAKMAMLRRAGVASKDLYLVVLNDLVRREDHAVLVVRSEGRFLVLDNGGDAIVDSDSVRDYRPILTFTQGQTFTHGYRREPAAQPPVVLAALEMPRPIAPLVPAANEAASDDAPTISADSLAEAKPAMLAMLTAIPTMVAVPQPAAQ